MTFLGKSVRLSGIVGVLCISQPVWADVAPDDQCLEQDVGKPCDNAGNGFEPGVCAATQCTRATPNGSMTYDCFRCLPSAGGAGGAGGATNEPSTGGSTAGGGTGGSSSSAGSGAGGKKSDDGGCSVSALGAAGGLGAWLLALGLVSAGVSRRRSRGS